MRSSAIIWKHTSAIVIAEDRTMYYLLRSPAILLAIIWGAFHYAKDSGNFGWNSNGKVRFGFFRPEFGITSGGGPLISVGIFRSKFAVPFLTNRFFALIREFENDQKWQELFLLVGAV